MPIPRSVKRRAQLDQYSREADAYYGTPEARRAQEESEAQQALNAEPCAICAHRRDAHDVFDGPCGERAADGVKCRCGAFTVRKRAMAEAAEDMIEQERRTR